VVGGIESWLERIPEGLVADVSGRADDLTREVVAIQRTCVAVDQDQARGPRRGEMPPAMAGDEALFAASNVSRARANSSRARDSDAWASST
jgi:hypothetical protein